MSFLQYGVSRTSDSAILQHVLQRAPCSWEYRDYSTQLYHQILATGNEKNDVLRNLPDNMRDVSRVYRIQNPFLWGRYSLRKEQLQAKGHQVYESTYYHPISRSDKTTVMKYNLDYRRYSYRYEGQWDSTRKPLLYTDPQTARNAISAHDTVLVVVKALEVAVYTSGYVNTYKDLDTEYYPAYIIEF